MSANQINKGREKSLPLNSQSKILELKNITKRFGPVIANDNVSLDVIEGTIHGIVGFSFLKPPIHGISPRTVLINSGL